MLDWSDRMPPLASPMWKTTTMPGTIALRTPPPACRRPSIKCEIVGHWECHVQAHQPPTCDKCLYARNRRSWFEHTALDAASGCTNTWICTNPLDTLDADWGIGCKACAWAMNKSKNTVDARTIPYAMLNVKGSTVRLSNLIRHVASATHTQHTTYYSYMHGQGNSGTPLLQGAPSVEEFKNTWHNIKSVSGGTKDRKHCSMQWCLYEALEGVGTWIHGQR